MSVSALARSLIEIPSHEDPGPAGDVIEEWLTRETDATVRRDRVGNVFATRGSGPIDLAFVGHHDVVPPAGAQVMDGEYLVKQRDGRLYGRGSADMKGSLAAAMIAFRDVDPAGTLAFASFVDEEGTGVGARTAIEDGFVPKCVIVLEGSTGYSAPNVTDVAIAHNGRRSRRITVTGAPAHASEPEAGDNAIYRACETIGELRSLEWPTVTVADETLRGSLAVTGIEGGSVENMIPATCELTVDERTVPGAEMDWERLTSMANLELTTKHELPPMRCSDAVFAGAAVTAADEVQSGRPKHVTKPHATDAGRLSAAGSACIVIGAAEPGEAHTDTESVSIDTIERCERIYRCLAAGWPRDTGA